MKTIPAEVLETAFLCDTCWHLPGLAFRIYELARRVSHRTKKFYPSLKSLAFYFQVSESTVQRAKGFFEVLDEGPFISTVYKVLSHEEFVRKYPDQCCQKEVFAWSDDPRVDPLGQQFYARSGGRIKFRTSDMKGLRKLGLSDEQLLSEFERFFDQTWPNGYSGKCYSTMFSGRFVRHIKGKQGTKLQTLRGAAKKSHEAKEAKQWEAAAPEAALVVS